MFGKRGLLVSIDANNPDDATFIIVKGKKPIKNGSLPIKQLKKLKFDYMRFSIQSELSYFDTATLNVPNKKLAALAAKRYIDRQAVFSEPFVTRYKPVKNASQKSYLLAAMQNSDIQMVDSFMDEIIDYIAPSAIVIANLANKLIDIPIKAIWIKRNIQIEIDIEETINSIKISRTIEEPNRYEKKSNLLFLGEYYDKNSKAMINRLKIPKTELETALKFPEIYGLLFVDKDFNFIKDELAYQIHSYKLSKNIIGISAIATILLLYGAAKNFVNYNNLNERFLEKRNKLELQNKALMKKLPDQKEIDLLFKVATIQKNSTVELSLGKFLSWLTGIIPSGTKINAISIKPFVIKNSNRRGLAARKSKPVSGWFTARLKVSSKGSYKTTKKMILSLVKSMAEKVKLSQSTLSYTKKTGMANFTTKLLIDGRKF